MMRKLWRTTLWLLIFVILLSLPVFAAEDGGAGSLTFFVSGTPTNFKDVSSKSWYYANVREMTALGLMQGVGKDRFAPEENMEVAEAVALAARVHAVYTYASTDPVESLPVGKQWYDRYYDYLPLKGSLQWRAGATKRQKMPPENWWPPCLPASFCPRISKRSM